MNSLCSAVCLRVKISQQRESREYSNCLIYSQHVQMQSTSGAGYRIIQLYRRCSGSLTHFLILQNECFPKQPLSAQHNNQTIFCHAKPPKKAESLGLHNIKSVIRGCHMVPPEQLSGTSARTQRAESKRCLVYSLEYRKKHCFSIFKNTLVVEHHFCQNSSLISCSMQKYGGPLGLSPVVPVIMDVSLLKHESCISTRRKHV